MFRFIGVASLLAAFVTPAVAQSSSLETYGARVMSLYIYSGEAEVVGMCGIRSNDWVVSITSNVAIGARLMAQQMGIDPATTAALEKRAYENSRPQPPTAASCQKMARSDLVAKLDQLQFTLSGGYH